MRLIATDPRGSELGVDRDLGADETRALIAHGPLPSDITRHRSVSTKVRSSSAGLSRPVYQSSVSVNQRLNGMVDDDQDVKHVRERDHGG